MKTIVLSLLGSATVGVAGALIIIFFGFYDVSAQSDHFAITRWVLSTTSHSSVHRRASEVTVPDLSGSNLVKAGVSDFEAMCIGCHGAPGKPRSAMGQGLNPQAPNLSESAQHMSAAELFWVTKHGIKMTGMPSWGVTHDDDAIWPVVALMQALPTMSAIEYGLLVSRSEGHGHHAPETEVHDTKAAASYGRHEGAAAPTTTQESLSTPKGHEGHNHEH